MREINKRVILLGAIIAVSLAFLIGFSMRASAEPWIIGEGESETMDSDKTVNGMVIIDGTLTIESGWTLEIDCTDMSWSMIVAETGKLIMKDSAKIIGTDSTGGDNKTMDITIFGTVDITNCEIDGLENGIIFERGSTVTNFSISLKNYNLGLIRRGVDKPTDDSITFDNDEKISQYWYANVTITNGDGGNIENAEVKIKNGDDIEVGSIVTGPNGWADFGDILVKQDATNYNDFKIHVKAHKDDEENYHVTPGPTTHTINDNYEGIAIPINEAINPDFSIMDFKAEKSPMILEETNKLTVIIRNMGEKTSTASIEFYAKKEGEDYKSIKDMEEDIPAETSDYEVYYDWEPTEPGNYDIKVEVKPKAGADQYPGDDNTPAYTSVSVLQLPEIEIDTPNEGSTVSGVIDVEGTYEGSPNWIRVWLNDDDTTYIVATSDNEDWSCKLDTGVYNGANQVIHVKIFSDGIYYKEDDVKVTLKNEPEVTIDYPINNEKLTAKSKDYTITISGDATKKSRLALDIEGVELKIRGELQSVTPVKQDDTRWTWLYEWNIASTNDGIYDITAQSKDSEARKSVEQKITVTVDNQPPHSTITIPKINITTEEPTEPVNEKILIKGTAEDDWEIKKIEAKIEDEGAWFDIKKDINKDKCDWEYTWDVGTLGIGMHTIYFRAVDEETDVTDIIDKFYPIVSFNISKTIDLLPDLEITSVKILKGDKEVKTANNEDNLTFEITIKVHNRDRIKQPITIYIELSDGNNTLGNINETIDSNVSETYKVTISWTVHGEKGKYKYTIEIDKGNNLEEEKEDNNVQTVELEILDKPADEDNGKKDDGFIPTIGAIGLIIAMIAATSIVVFLKRKR